MFDGVEDTVRNLVENLKFDENKKDRLAVMLTTTGGSATAVERGVAIFRKHYTIVDFIVPDYAYSAGTILCMSGDNIYMDYFSVLGPIDPQVRNKEGKWVPALGYLDKVNEAIQKSKANDLTQLEYLMVKELDLAELRGYEQAKELTVVLLKDWLVKYKFKNWNTHETNPGKRGKSVTLKEKQQRAKRIAQKLGDNKFWKSHGRPINMECLKVDLRLRIEDFSSEATLNALIRDYYVLWSDSIDKNSEFELSIITRNNL